MGKEQLEEEKELPEGEKELPEGVKGQLEVEEEQLEGEKKLPEGEKEQLEGEEGKLQDLLELLDFDIFNLSKALGRVNIALGNLREQQFRNLFRHYCKSFKNDA